MSSLSPSLVDELLEEWPSPTPVEQLVLSDADYDALCEDSQSSTEEQFGGALPDVAQHIDIGRQYEQYVRRLGITGTAYNVQFRDLDQIANIPQFIVQVCFTLVILG